MQNNIKKKKRKDTVKEKDMITQEELEHIFFLVAKRIEKSPLGKQAGFRVVSEEGKN